MLQRRVLAGLDHRCIELILEACVMEDGVWCVEV